MTTHDLEGSVELERTLLSDNHAGAQGGAVYFWISGELVLQHSTLIANSSQRDGGGLAAWAPSGTLTLREKATPMRCGHCLQ